MSEPTFNIDYLMTRDDVARVLRCKRGTVDALVRQGKLKSLTVSRNMRRFTADQVRDYIQLCIDMQAGKVTQDVATDTQTDTFLAV